MPRRLENRIIRIRSNHSYMWVCLLLVLMVLWAIAAPESDWARFILVALQGATLVVAGLTSDAPARLVRAVAVLAFLALFGALVGGILGENVEGVTSLLGAMLVLLTPLLMLRGLGIALREFGVTLQVVFGAVAVYLLIGVFCASVYGTIARYGGQALFSGGNGDGTLSEHYYFSFVTQATVGYGDFAPGSSFARSVAVFQALVGQLYLVTVLALLVSNLGRGPGRRLRETDQG